MHARLLGGVLAATALLSPSACSGDDLGGQPGLTSEDTLTVCSSVPYAPFEMRRGGGYTGFDIDLMREVAAGMGLTMSVRDVGFGGLRSGASLAAGRCDVAASAMTITADRERNLDFSQPYYTSQQSLLVPSGSDIETLDDLAGRQVGVQRGTTGKLYAEANVPGRTRLVSYPGDAEMYAAIRAGDVDAILQDLAVNVTHTRQGDFEVVQTYRTDEAYGFAVAEEGSGALLRQVDAELARLKRNGTYQEIFDRYFPTTG
jgi:polar amino acid transport system substrate-binding protein